MFRSPTIKNELPNQVRILLSNLFKLEMELEFSMSELVAGLLRNKCTMFQLFSGIDVTNNASINKANLDDFLEANCINASYDDLNAIWKILSLENKPKISYNEFVDAVFPFTPFNQLEENQSPAKEIDLLSTPLQKKRTEEEQIRATETTKINVCSAEKTFNSDVKIANPEIKKSLFIDNPLTKIFQEQLQLDCEVEDCKEKLVKEEGFSLEGVMKIFEIGREGIAYSQLSSVMKKLKVNLSDCDLLIKRFSKNHSGVLTIAEVKEMINPIIPSSITIPETKHLNEKTETLLKQLFEKLIQREINLKKIRETYFKTVIDLNTAYNEAFGEWKQVTEKEVTTS